MKVTNIKGNENVSQMEIIDDSSTFQLDWKNISKKNAAGSAIRFHSFVTASSQEKWIRDRRLCKLINVNIFAKFSE